MKPLVFGPTTELAMIAVTALLLLIIATMMLPPQVTMIPVYIAWSKIGLTGTYWPLLIPQFFGSAFFIFTKAPATGAPAASLTTPCSTPRLSAPRTELADTITINTNIATIFPFIRFGMTFLLRGFLVKDIFNLSILVGNKTLCVYGV